MSIVLRLFMWLLRLLDIVLRPLMWLLRFLANVLMATPVPVVPVLVLWNGAEQPDMILAAGLTVVLAVPKMIFLAPDGGLGWTWRWMISEPPAFCFGRRVNYVCPAYNTARYPSQWSAVINGTSGRGGNAYARLKWWAFVVAAL